jgi:mannan endo-1,6-alpha-mannosidase
MSALSVIQSTLINFAPALLTNSTGGSSVGNPAAGTGSDENPGYIVPATNADRAGAGFLTALLVIIAMGGIGFMVTGV